MEKEFNLLNEPWIAVRIGTKTKDVSLKEALCKAHEADALSGELPTQDVAILRLLLAVLYAIFLKVDGRGNLAPISDDDDAIARWRSLWSKGCFPEHVINDYLNSDLCNDSFWLFHPQRPFFQVAGLRTQDGKTNPIAQIIADIPSREERRFFSDISGDEAQTLSYAQAARWLVHLQAWDYAGKKASIVGGSPNGGGTGWCGKLGIVYALGNNLFETLMLNLILNCGDKHINDRFIPTWSQKNNTAAKRAIIPASYMELLCLQSRRARLFNKDGRVYGIISSYGDVFDKENTFHEKMSGWHLSSVKNQGFIPNTHNSSRSMWRDLAAILPQSGEKVRRPSVLDWLDTLRYDGMVNLCAVGYEYGSMQGVVTAMICDSLSINAELFSKLSNDYVTRILDMLDVTEKAISALSTLANNLAQASGGEGAKTGQAARERSYHSLDEPFRAWLRGIDPKETSIDDECGKWAKVARRIILREGDALIDDAGVKAFAGRMIEKDKASGNRALMNASTAEIRFKARVKECLGGGE